MNIAVLAAAALVACGSAGAGFVPGAYRQVEIAALSRENLILGAEEGVMIPGPGMPLEWYRISQRGPRVGSGVSRALRRGYTSLLSQLDYDPATRNQGSCGNCWAWAGIACVAIDLSRQMGITDALSVQHLDSCYADPDYACCGGWASYVADFYAAEGRALPWSNLNAAYADGSSTCAAGASGVGCSALGTSPAYPIDSISSAFISTYGETQADAIANIKSELDSGKAVWFAYYTPNSADRTVFRTFWRNQTEGEYLDMAYVDGHSWDPASASGHAVCCVGYDDTDPANPVWIMLNSWGSRTNRPNGIFLIAMDTDYSSYISYYGLPIPSSYWAVYDIAFSDPVTTTATVTTTTGITTTATVTTTTVITTTTTTTTAVYPGAAVPGDFNGDGTAELALWRPATGTWLLRGLTAAAFGASTDLPAPADYDGDGAWDIAVFRPGLGKWLVRGFSSFFYGFEGDTPVPADYDGDGAAELGVYRSAKGKWFLRGVSSFTWGASADLPVPADYDGDGRTDAGLFRPATGKWFVRDLTRVSHGAASDCPVPADYDGDSTTDVAVFRPGLGRWFIRHLTQVAYGVSTDTPVPADYDGDGSADIALYRSARGKWFVSGLSSVLFGSSGDVPVLNP